MSVPILPSSSSEQPPNPQTDVDLHSMTSLLTGQFSKLIATVEKLNVTMEGQKSTMDEVKNTLVNHGKKFDILTRDAEKNDLPYDEKDLDDEITCAALYELILAKTKEKTDEWNGTIDVTLIFIALFSAVLTAFLVPATQALLPNSNAADRSSVVCPKSTMGAQVDSKARGVKLERKGPLAYRENGTSGRVDQTPHGDPISTPSALHWRLHDRPTVPAVESFALVQWRSHYSAGDLGMRSHSGFGYRGYHDRYDISRALAYPIKLIAGGKWLGQCIVSAGRLVGRSVASGGKWIGRYLASGGKWLGPSFTSRAKWIGQSIVSGGDHIRRFSASGGNRIGSFIVFGGKRIGDAILLLLALVYVVVYGGFHLAITAFYSLIYLGPRLRELDLVVVAQRAMVMITFSSILDQLRMSRWPTGTWATRSQELWLKILKLHAVLTVIGKMVISPRLKEILPTMVVVVVILLQPVVWLMWTLGMALEWTRDQRVHLECNSMTMLMEVYLELMAETSEPGILERTTASFSLSQWVRYGGGTMDELWTVRTRLMASHTSFRVRETMNRQFARLSLWFSQRQREPEEVRSGRAREDQAREKNEEVRVIELTKFLVGQRTDEISRHFAPTRKNCTEILNLLSLPFDEFIAKCLCDRNIDVGNHRKIFHYSVAHCLNLLRVGKSHDVARILSHVDLFSAVRSFVLVDNYYSPYDRVVKPIIGDRRAEALRFLAEFLSTRRDWSDVDSGGAAAVFLIAAGSPPQFTSDIDLSPIIGHIGRHPSWKNWREASDTFIEYLMQCDISALSERNGVQESLQRCVDRSFRDKDGVLCSSSEETRLAAETLLDQHQALFTPPSSPSRHSASINDAEDISRLSDQSPSPDISDLDQEPSRRRLNL
ncbi:hypothetical protein SISNIDRAFT_532514 [Sistotremastrum niveocremeum HHB9708]|uniref:DUF6535 domain-containing protein n=1 Tax=Sistotremastrum niveocremeum HHB9708 TaxID=1314777 RepID=A0A164NZZ2_9AGAM|nr:hypothetical protein SISNIDRAFT_532514 [Sistotremastrum niveocremeum HHB9708]